MRACRSLPPCRSFTLPASPRVPRPPTLGRFRCADTPQKPASCRPRPPLPFGLNGAAGERGEHQKETGQHAADQLLNEETPTPIRQRMPSIIPREIPQEKYRTHSHTGTTVSNQKLPNHCRSVSIIEREIPHRFWRTAAASYRRFCSYPMEILQRES